MTKKIIMDYGHGGNDPGARGNGLIEKNVVLSLGKEITKILRDNRVVVVETRTGDQTTSLKARSGLANREKADIFVSIHANAFGQASANGVETFSYPGSKNGAKLAKSIQDEIVKAKLFKRDRGTKTANFHVLRETIMPSALVELGFITNKDDANVLKSKHDDIALAVAKGILAYLGISYNKPSTSPSKPATSTYKGNSIVTYLNSIKVDSSFANRKKLATKHGIKNYKGTAEQNLKLLAILRNDKTTPPKPSTPKKSIADIAKEVIDGKWGNGATRKSRLEKAGYNFTTVQSEVNRLISGSPVKKKSTREIAREVIEGKWGNGIARKNKLEKAGYNYANIQKEVNRLLK